MNLVESLDKMLGFLRKHNHAVSKHLQAGLTIDNVVNALRENDLPVSDEVVSLYTWRNGIDIENIESLDDIHFIPGFYILNFDDALAFHNELRSLEDWKRHWLPILANGGGDFFAVDLEQGDCKSSQIIAFVRGYPEQEPEYESLLSMINTFLDCVEKNIVFVDDEGYLDMDDDAHILVAKANNPSIDCWKE